MLFLLQRGKYPVTAINANEVELVLARISTRVQSVTAQILTDNPILRHPFWDGPHFWEGKWKSGYNDDLQEWVELNGGEQRLFGKRLAADQPEEDEEDEKNDEDEEEEEAGPSVPQEPETRPVDTGQGL